MNDAVLTLRELGVSYDKKTVLEDVSARIRPNRITAVIGPSGCGKSTLLKAMNRSLELEKGAEVRGSILLGDTDIRSMPAEELRRRVGMVFQTPTPFPLSVYKNMTYGEVAGLLAIVGEIKESMGVNGAGREIFVQYKKKYPRHSSFQKEMKYYFNM